LQVSYAATLLKGADDAFIIEMTSLLDPQLATSILMHLPQDDRERMSKHLSEKLKGQIRELLDYPEGSIGRTMTTDFIALNKDILSDEAIDKIRALAKKRFPSSYVYVVDEANRLFGVLNMRDLMLAQPDKKLEDICRRDIFALHCFIDREEAANELAKRKFFAAPVVDSENHVLGIIKAERLIQGVQEEMSKDIQMMFGAGRDERVSSSISFSLKKRLPWLHINLATAFLAAGVVAMYEGIIAKLTVLAVFLPVVAGQGGNAGAQSLAVVMRGIVMREISKDKIFQLILKEGKIGAVNGTIIGVVTALAAWVWNGNPFLGLVIGLGMLVNLIVAGLSGASIPLLMKKVGIDPAQSSSIILTTVTDVLGFMAFLGFAVLFQNFLVP
jgi:magnesium transporter